MKFYTLSLLCIAVTCTSNVYTKKNKKNYLNVVNNRFVQRGSVILSGIGLISYDRWKSDWIQKTAQQLQNTQMAGRPSTSHGLPSGVGELESYLPEAHKEFTKFIKSYRGGTFVDTLDGMARQAWKNPLMTLSALAAITYLYCDTKEQSKKIKNIVN